MARWSRSRGSIPGMGKRFFSTPQHPDRFWCSPNLLYNRHLGLFCQRQSGRSLKLTTHLYLVSTPSIRLHFVMLNKLRPGITLPLKIYLYKSDRNTTHVLTLTVKDCAGASKTGNVWEKRATSNPGPARRHKAFAPLGMDILATFLFWEVAQ